MMKIHLASYETMMAVSIGGRRQIAAIYKGLKDQHGYEGSGWEVHINAAGGEIAGAKAMDRYWSGSVNTFRCGGDVGEIQIKTRSAHHYDLLVRPQDRDDDIFVLVTGVIPDFRVHGWLRGRDAKKPEWLKTHGERPPAYFAPQFVLHPIVDLP